MKQLIEKWTKEGLDYEAEAEKAWAAECVEVAQQYERLAELCISHVADLEEMSKQ